MESRLPARIVIQNHSLHPVTLPSDPGDATFTNDNLDDSPSSLVLHQCITLLQGISDGENCLFYANKFCPSLQLNMDSASSLEGVLCNANPFGLRSTEAASSSPVPSMDMNSPDVVLLCGTVGVYVRCIQRFVFHHSPDDSSSILRAFRCALQEELKNYFSFITTLLSQISTNPSPQGRLITVLELLYRVDPYVMRLKFLAMIVSMVPTTNIEYYGISLLSHLHRHLVNNGNRLTHVPLLTTILQVTIQPWFDMLYDWTIDGCLKDDYQTTGDVVTSEFFITARPHISDRELWRHGYVLQYDHIPLGIFDSDSVVSDNVNSIDLIFMVGKGVNFIRRCLHDTDWSLLSQLLLSIQAQDDADENCLFHVEGSSKTTRMKFLGFTYESLKRSTSNNSSRSALRRTLVLSSTLVHSHVLSCLRAEFCLEQHLYAMKQFLLFGQGDFYCTLLDLLYMEFDQKGSTATTGIIGVYRHTLSSIVDQCIKSTNASNFSSNILERLQVHVLLDKNDDANFLFAVPRKTSKQSSNDVSGDERTIWDIFTLTYTVPDPMVSVVDSSSVQLYRTVFMFLFRINHIEYRLNLAWRKNSMLQHALHTNAQHLGITILSNFAYQQAIQLLRQIAVTRQAMVHFITNLKSYLMYEVIDCCWKRFRPVMQGAKTLNEIIREHDRYLHEIVTSCFLKSTNQAVDDDFGLPGILEVLLEFVKNFCLYQEVLFGDALEAADRAAQKRTTAALLAKQGSWGFHREREAAEQETCFGLSDSAKLATLDRFSEGFNKQVILFLQGLDTKLNGFSLLQESQPGIRSTPKPSFPGSIHGNSDISSPVDLDSLRHLASQLNQNKFYGVTNF